MLNYGLAQQLKHGMDVVGTIGTEGMYTAILAIFDTLPLPWLAILLLVMLLISLLNWVAGDLTQSFTLLQKNF